MTEIVQVQRTKPCGYCGDGIPEKSPKKYCNKECYFAAWRSKGPDLFWPKVDKTSHQGGCWLYMGFRKWDGYGWLARWSRGKARYMTAHRYAWILTHGEPPEGMHILHKCDNPPCCNPDHLRLGTHLENMAEMKERGRANSGHAKKYKPVLHPDRVRPRRQA